MGVVEDRLDMARLDRRRRGQSLTPRRRRSAARGQADDAIMIMPPAIESCTGEQWQHAIDLLAELLVPIVARDVADQRRAA